MCTCCRVGAPGSFDSSVVGDGAMDGFYSFVLEWGVYETELRVSLLVGLGKQCSPLNCCPVCFGLEFGDRKSVV